MQYRFLLIDPRCGGSANPILPWIDTGLSISSGQRLTVMAMGFIHLYPPEFESAMPWAGPNGCTSCPLINPANLLNTSIPAATLLGYVGTTPAPCTPGFRLGAFYDQIASSTGSVYLSINDYCAQFDINPAGYYYEDNRGRFLAVVLVDAPDECVDGLCEEGFTYLDRITANPIKLRTATKIAEATDFSLSTPAGEMTFTRRYNQDRLNDAQYEHMGLGWSHNHHYGLLLSGTTPNRLAEIPMPSGGVLRLDETGSGVFSAQAGSTAEMRYDGMADEYILVLQDQTAFVFDGTAPYDLKRRTWPGGAAWTYTFVNGLLDNVDDGHGRELRFSYYDGLGGSDAFKNGQLWRVGDHTAADLDTGSPSGRYIELDYVPESVDGTPIGSPRALLSSVSDVRNPLWHWLYDYYGQYSGETNTHQLNFLTQRETPEVDTDGDGSEDGRLTLETLTYTTTMSGAIAQIVQGRGDGLLETEYTFQPSGVNMTAETTAGRTTEHYFANGVYLGPINPIGDMLAQPIGEDYRPQARIDGNGSETALTWEANGKRLTQVTDPLEHETDFTYDADDRLATSLDAQGQRTLYIYADSNSPRQPSHLLVTDEADSPSNLIVNGDMEATGNWANVGTPDTNERSDMAVDMGSYARHVVADAGEGIASEAWDVQADVPYVIRARVYVVSGAVRMGVTGTSAFDAFSTTTGWWETLLAIHTPGSGSSGVQLMFVADGGSAEFYVDSVYALPGTRLLRWETFSYDSLGRTLIEQSIDPTDGTTVLRETQRTYHTSGSGDGLLASLTHVDVADAGNNQSTSYTYDSAGRVIKTQRSSLFGSCDISFTVYDLAGNVVATICNYDPGLNPDPTTAAEAAALYNPAEPDKNRVMTYRFDEMGRQVATTANAGADFAQTTLTLYDALDRPWRVINNYTNPLVSEDPDEYTYTPPGTWVWDEANSRWQDSNDTPISHGDDRNQNLINDTLYNARGLTRMQRDVLGNVTLFGYDDADRLARTVQNASDPDYDNDYTSGDPDLSDYEVVSTPDQDIMTSQRYDSAGNLIEAADPLEQRAFTVYDALNRPVKVVQSAKDSAIIGLSVPGDPDYEAANDPRSDDYEPSADPDRDLITTTSYDALGRTLQTGQLIAQAGEVETWVYTRSVYDERGQLRLTVQNYVDQGEDPALWLWDEADARWEQSDGTPIAHGVNHDQNLISEQVYDEAGRVRFSRDTGGTKTWLVYDGLGRQVKQITGCTYVSGSPAPEDSGYVGAVDDPAADVISERYFDADGRVIRTRTLLRYDKGSDELVWVWALTGYDTLGRQVKAVQNASDPDYDLSADPDLSAYTPSGNPDEDIITEAAYDAEGRVYKTTNTLGSVTLYGFDTSGRQVKVIQNASDPDYDVTTDPDLSGYTPSSEPDEDRINQTSYDVVGRVVKATDALGHVTLTGYDRAGRQVKVIQNASDPDYDTAADPDLSSYTGDNPDDDQDRITTTVYDKGGRTVSTTDVQGNVILTGYDRAGRAVRTVQNASDPNYDTAADPDLSSYTGDNPDDDQDRITISGYDKGGRTVREVDAGGVETRHVYDNPGQRLRSVLGYLAQGATDPADWLWNAVHRRWEDGAGNPIAHSAAFDRNLISDTAYDLAGRVSAARDARGTLATFSYDRLGRRLTVTEAVDTDLETVSYACYDKAGRVERFIQNWQDTGVTPDAKDENGDWLFKPTRHGTHNDRDLITVYQHDLAGRQTAVTDPADNTAAITYFRDGQVDAETDPEGTVTLFRYDGLRRRVLVVQGYNANGEDPAEWVWDEGDGRWEESNGTPIVHGADNDQNIIVRVTLDKAGRMVSLRNPLGSLIEYEYDALGRRTKLTNPLNDDWLTAYEDLVGGGTRVTTTYPGLSSGGAYNVQRDFDRLGRPVEIDYGAADVTPRVTFEYDPAGNRAVMREYDTSAQIRKTSYGYDTVRRLVGVDFDTDGDDDTDETVSYEYDLGGRRTKLTLPGDLSITYRYDAKGQMVGLTDWDGQNSDFFYDRAGRHVGTQRATGLLSDYRYNPAGYLRRIRHFVGSLSSLRAHFEFQVDGRGNRTQAYERLAEPTTITDTYDKDAAEVDYTAGTWTDEGDFKQSTQFSAKMTVTWTGDEGLLTMGTGPDHSLFDVYIGGTLWQSYDGYAPVEDERVIHLPADALLEIRNRADKNIQSTGYVIRFKQLEALEVTYDERTIQYTYDALSRLTEANYNSGAEIFTYGFDVAGNLTNLNGASRTYNAANQLVNDGTNNLTYDANGNMTSDGVNSHAWDRANRLLSMGGISYAYNGDGNRIQQAALNYILDLQPGLVQVLGDSDGNRYIHSPRGIHAVNDGMNWQYPVTDALGSVRGYTDTHSNVLSNVSYTLVGVPDANITGPAFTGEWRTGGTGMQYHRARHYNPNLGIFPSLDPFEGVINRPMSLNGYSWVEGNPVMNVDPSGMVCEGLEGYALYYCLQYSSCPNNNLPISTPPSCSLNNRIAQIASYARQEMNQEDEQELPTAAAIAIAEIHYLTFGNNVPRASTSTYPSSTTYVNSATSTKIYNLVSNYVAGECNGNLRRAVEQQFANYPELTQYQDDLLYLASERTIAYQHSFKSNNRAEGVASNYPFGVLYSEINFGERLAFAPAVNIANRAEEFKFRVIRGETTSVVVSNYPNPVPLEWNCSVNENRVINSGFNPNIAERAGRVPSWVENSQCRANCNRSLWWWRPTIAGRAKEYAGRYPALNPQYVEGDAWVKIPRTELANIGRGSGHVADC